MLIRTNVRVLSYSTHGSGGTGASVSKVKEAVALTRVRRPTLKVDGELQGDAALSTAVAKRKTPESASGGTANILIFPSLDSGNIAYKLVSQLSPGTQSIGPILQGFKKPLSDVSRGASVDDIVHVATITALQGV